MSRNLPLVWEVFALFFSSSWLARWQKQWRLPSPLPDQPGRQCQRTAPAPAQTPKKPPAPGRFYQRLFSLRVTLWYLIFQRLNFDHALAAVLVEWTRTVAAVAAHPQ